MDLHSVAYYHMKKRGVPVPTKNNHSALNLDAILAYVGLSTRSTAHHALMDAKLEGEAFSRLLSGAGLLPEFEKYPVLV